MRILILGADGYLGWPTAMHFAARGDDVALVDNYVKRRWEDQTGGAPLFGPHLSLVERARAFPISASRSMAVYDCDVKDGAKLFKVFDEFKPEAIVHYAEQPSAPFSMMDRHYCMETQGNNILGTLNVLWQMKHSAPDAHLVKLGTMGEYGTPNIDIEEGWLDVEHNGRRDRMLYPKKPGSFYHASKVADSVNIEFACRSWGLRATDLNQGIVYGMETDQMAHDPPNLRTAFHYDDLFGTVLNRFCVQAAIGEPLTVYGDGSQRRAFLNIRDTLRCVELAVENRADAGEFRVFNQFTEVFSIMQLAEIVREAAKDALGANVSIARLDNPRVEQLDHYFNPKNDALLKLGLEPRKLGDELVQSMLKRIASHKDRVRRDLIKPRVRWQRGASPA